MVHESLRLKALRSYELLDTAPHPAFDAVTQAAHLAFEAPIALVTLVDKARQWFKSSVGLELRETSRDVSFCAHAVGERDVFVVEDASLDERFKANPLVTGEPHIRFYAGAPIVDSEGFALGTLCIIDSEPRSLTENQRALLRNLSNCAMTAITAHSQGVLLRRADRSLQHYVSRSAVAG